MRLGLLGRKGVASVIGTMLFIVVLMAGLGAVAYVYSLQSQSTQAAQRAQQLLNQRGKEQLSYALSSGVLSITNAGPTASELVAVILKYPNGTVYSSGAGSWAAQSTYLPSGVAIQVQTVIPSGTCGGTTCLAKYSAIIAGKAPAGSMVGELTSLGNVFWYNPSASSVPPGTTVLLYVDDTPVVGATGTSSSASMSYNLPANAYSDIRVEALGSVAGGGGTSWAVSESVSFGSDNVFSNTVATGGPEYETEPDWGGVISYTMEQQTAATITVTVTLSGSLYTSATATMYSLTVWGVLA